MTTSIIYIVVLALVAGLPLLLDICLAYRSRNKTRNLLVEKASIRAKRTTRIYQRNWGTTTWYTWSCSICDGPYGHSGSWYSCNPYTGGRSPRR
jgi:hypothetical protein